MKRLIEEKNQQKVQQKQNKVIANVFLKNEICQKNVKVLGKSVGCLGSSSYLGKNSLLVSRHTNKDLKQIGIGTNALMANESGHENLAIGTNSLINLISGSSNLAIGNNTLYRSLSGNYNITLGHSAMFNTEKPGSYNLALGNNTLMTNQGDLNIALGFDSLGKSTSSNNNLAIGNYSLKNNNSKFNISIGESSLENNVYGEENIVIGNKSGNYTKGNKNIILGNYSAQKLNTSDNLILGNSSLKNTIFSKKSIVLGNDSGKLLKESINNIVIGNNCIEKKISKSIGNILLGNNIAKKSKFINDNVLIGENILEKSSTSLKNIIIGKDSARSLEGYNNILIGVNSVSNKTRSSSNIVLGNHSLVNSSVSQNNIILGENVLLSNDLAIENIVIGNNALQENTQNFNIAIGNRSLQKNQEGSMNIALGFESMTNSNFSKNNIGIGVKTLNKIESDNNIAIGNNSGLNSRKGYGNISVGSESLLSNINSSNNTCLGTFSMRKSTYGNSNTAIGYMSLHSNKGDNNIAIGKNSLINNNGNNNICIGNIRFIDNNSQVLKGNDNINIGSNNYFIDRLSNIICIGNNLPLHNIIEKKHIDGKKNKFKNILNKDADNDRNIITELNYKEYLKNDKKFIRTNHLYIDDSYSQSTTIDNTNKKSSSNNINTKKLCNDNSTKSKLYHTSFTDNNSKLKKSTISSFNSSQSNRKDKSSNGYRDKYTDSTSNSSFSNLLQKTKKNGKLKTIKEISSDTNETSSDSETYSKTLTSLSNNKDLNNIDVSKKRYSFSESESVDSSSLTNNEVEEWTGNNTKIEKYSDSSFSQSSHTFKPKDSLNTSSFSNIKENNESSTKYLTDKSSKLYENKEWDLTVKNNKEKSRDNLSIELYGTKDKEKYQKKQPTSSSLPNKDSISYHFIKDISVDIENSDSEGDDDISHPEKYNNLDLVLLKNEKDVDSKIINKISDDSSYIDIEFTSIHNDNNNNNNKNKKSSSYHYGNKTPETEQSVKKIIKTKSKINSSNNNDKYTISEDLLSNSDSESIDLNIKSLDDNSSTKTNNYEQYEYKPVSNTKNNENYKPKNNENYKPKNNENYKPKNKKYLDKDLVVIGNGYKYCTLDLSEGPNCNWKVPADGRLKTNISQKTPGLNYILDLEPVSFQWKYPKELEDKNKDNKTVPIYHPNSSRQFGLIAQNVKQVNIKHKLDDWNNVTVSEDDNSNIAEVSLVSMILPLIKSVQTLNKKIEILEQKNYELEIKLNRKI